LRLDGLRLQLLGLVILPFSLVLLAVSIAGVVVHEEAMRTLVTDRDLRVARTAAAALDHALQSRRSTLDAFAMRLSTSSGFASALEAEAQAALLFDGGLAEVTPDGRIVASTGAWADRPAGLLIDGLAEGEGALSEPFREGDAWMTLVAQREGGMVAVGALSLDGLLHEALGSGSLITGSTTLTLLDSSGAVLAQLAGTPGEHPLTGEGVSEAGQAAVMAGPEGPRVVAASPVADTGWVLVIEEPWEHITSPALDLSLVAPLVLIPAFLLTLVGLGFGARRVIAPLRQLEQQAGRLAEGDYSAARTPVNGIAEVRHLQLTMARMADRIHNAQRALQSYIGAITRAQEDERRRLARELHDETIQDLIALDQRLQMLAMDLRETDPSRASEAENLHRAANGAIEEVRRMMRALRPTYLEELGLSPALEMLARDASQEIGIPVSFHVEGQSLRLAPEAELALYRIVQQALSNIGRHAEATQAWVSLGFRPERLTTVVRDDGRGFALPGRLTDFIAKSHFGLMGMKERAELAGGSLALESSPGSGTVVRVDLPLDPAYKA